MLQSIEADIQDLSVCELYYKIAGIKLIGMHTN